MELLLQSLNPKRRGVGKDHSLRCVGPLGELSFWCARFSVIGFRVIGFSVIGFSVIWFGVEGFSVIGFRV